MLTLKNLDIGNMFFYKSSNIIYTIIEKQTTEQGLYMELRADNEHIWKVRSNYELYQEVIPIYNEPTKIPNYIHHSEINHYLLNNSKNAYEILCIFWEEASKDCNNMIENIIYENVKSVRLADFKHFTGLSKKDALHINFCDKALPLDIIALEMSELISQEISEERILEVLLDYPKGYINKVLEPITKKFKELTNIPIYRFLKKQQEPFKQLQKNEQEPDFCPF